MLSLGWLLCAMAIAEEPASDRVPDGSRDTWSKEHPLSVGSRLGMWRNGYTAPGFGGHAKVRPVRYLGVEGFWDNFVAFNDDVLLHDHIIGFSIFSPLLGNERGFLGPTAGLCVDFRFADPMGTEAPTASDVQFGAHAGLMSEIYIRSGISLELTAMGTRYLGNGATSEGWTASASNTLSWTGAMQGTASVNLTL